MLNLKQGDCLKVLPTFVAETVDVVITSPPYNLGAKYIHYNDRRPWDEYYEFIGNVSKELFRVVKPDGSFFLNIGATPKQPWTAMKVAEIIGQSWSLQNTIIWVKSIVIDKKTNGHYQPLNSPRFLNNNWEFIFHFTKDGNRKLDTSSLMVPYIDERNKERWETGTGKGVEGNCWFIKYETHNQNSKIKHPAMFPVELPERCIKLHGIADKMVVLDPFAGICSTLCACRNLSTDQYSIEGYGIEIDPAYIKIAQTLIS